jgi:hypothetical protein
MFRIKNPLVTKYFLHPSQSPLVTFQWSSLFLKVDDAIVALDVGSRILSPLKKPSHHNSEETKFHKLSSLGQMLSRGLIVQSAKCGDFDSERGRIAEFLLQNAGNAGGIEMMRSMIYCNSLR